MSAERKRWAWLLLYAAILLSPLLALMLGPRPAPRQFWRELSVALGFVGLALVGAQFVPTARLRAFTNVFSMDEVYYFHLRAAVAGFILMLAHPLLLIAYNPSTVRLLDPIAAPPAARLGLVSIAAFVALVVTSLFRQQLDMKYERWRLLHASLAIVGVLAATFHMLRVDHYLALPWQRGLWLTSAGLWVGLILNTRLIRPMRLLRRPYRLARIEPARERVWHLTVEPEGHSGLDFMPGQFAWLTFERSPFALRQHPFSIASSAARPGSLEFTIAAQGDFTDRVADLPLGCPVYVDGPHGTFTYLRHPGTGYVFIAGGIGAVPMMSMLRTMADRNRREPVWFFYGNVELSRITYRDELEELAGRMDLRVIHTLDLPPDGWQGEDGYIDAAMLERHLPADRAGLRCFVCGPAPMITNVLGALAEAGMPLGSILTEQYDMV